MNALLERKPQPLYKPEFIIPAFAWSNKAKRGMEKMDLRSLGFVVGQGGGERGFNAVGDVLTQTTDGRPLNELWTLFQQSLEIQNAARQKIIDFLTFTVSNVIEDVPQAGGTINFEEASEYGEPVGVRTTLSYFQMAYDFKWWDVGARFTWMYLAEATAQQVESVHNAILEADNRNIFGKVMKTIFNATNLTATIKGQNYTVFKFYNNDGTVPPPYKSNTFLSTHTHYRGSGAATIDSGDVEQMQTDLNEHGYTKGLGYQLILMVNKVQGDAIRTWRLNVVNANAAVAKYDFIPSTSQPVFILEATQQVAGPRPPGQIAGLDVIGSYGDFLVVQDDYIPAGYLFGFATGGENNLANPVGFRQHANASLQGLRLVKGRTPDYPLIDSFYNRGFGTGIRQRGAGSVMQIVASATYTPPALYA